LRYFEDVVHVSSLVHLYTIINILYVLNREN
jgi:hypothetical protein